MATGKPPWSEYEGVAAMFKIGNSKDLPTIPDHLSDEGKDFVKQCLQRNPLCRPTAAQLLNHAFVKKAAPLEKPVVVPEPLELPPKVRTGVKVQGNQLARNVSNLESERFDIHLSRMSKGNYCSREINIPKNISCPVSPIGSPLLYPRSSQNMNRRLSPSSIAASVASGPSTPPPSGVGTYPFRHPNQSVYLQESFTSKPKPSQCATYACNSPCYASPNRDIFQGMHSGGPQIFRDLSSSGSEVFGNRFGRPTNTGDGQLVLGDRVAQQLLRDEAKSGPSLDLSSCSPLPRPMN